MALAEVEMVLATGRAPAALRGCWETRASTSTWKSRGPDADKERINLPVGTMAAGEGNRGTTTAEVAIWAVIATAATVIGQGHGGAGAGVAAHTSTSRSTKTC